MPAMTLSPGSNKFNTVVRRATFVKCVSLWRIGISFVCLMHDAAVCITIVGMFMVPV